MNQLEPIKKICRDALEYSEQKHVCENALRKILYYIDKEEESYRLRLQYYDILDNNNLFK